MTSAVSIAVRPIGAAVSNKSATAPAQTTQTAPQELREQSQQNLAIRQLKARDRAVRAHELAHTSVGGRYAGQANLTYQRGPDGIQYAIGGEVPIDISEVPGNPQATLDKMRVVRRAALAPVNPSATDRAVAAAAGAKAARAAAELAKLQAEERETRGVSVDLLV